jgi:deoxyguanosine kinase
MYIAIEGNIAVGKSSLAEKLAKNISSEIITEDFTQNPYLAGFYNQPDKYAFILEISLLAERYNQLKNLAVKTTGKAIISDYSFARSLIFASINLDKPDLKIFNVLYKAAARQLPKPDILIYLHAPVDHLIDNIRKRNRNFERNISEVYLKKIEKKYLQYIKRVNFGKIVQINLEKLDFVHNPDDYRKITDLIGF